MDGVVSMSCFHEIHVHIRQMCLSILGFNLQNWWIVMKFGCGFRLKVDRQFNFGSINPLWIEFCEMFQIDALHQPALHAKKA
jgi:hypothetical protein